MAMEKGNSKMVISLKVSFKRVEHTAMVPTGLKKMNYLIAMLECGQMILGMVMGH